MAADTSMPRTYQLAKFHPCCEISDRVLDVMQHIVKERLDDAVYERLVEVWVTTSAQAYEQVGMQLHDQLQESRLC